MLDPDSRPMLVLTSGPRMCAIRRQPTEIRCSVASTPARSSSIPTKFAGSPVNLAVQQNVGHAALFNLPEAFHSQLCRSDNQRVDSPREHLIDLLLLKRDAFF